jgi:large subunit ribosomal protein L18
MANGPRYRVSMKRRREGKTNYQRRLTMVLSGKLRLVIRATLNQTIVQVVEAHLQGDKILVCATTKHLNKLFGWQYDLGNMPSSYLTGYLCGLRAKKAGIDLCILDIGILIHRNRVIAAFKGFVDAGINVPHDAEKFFKKTNLKDRVNGTHIKNYAELLIKEDKATYEKQFSNYIKNKLDPKNIVDDFDKTKKAIEKKV